MKLFKIIASSLLILATVILMVLSLFLQEGIFNNLFKISMTVTITFTLTLHMTLTINSIKDSFNTTNIYDSKNDNLDKAWLFVRRINAQVEIVIGMMEQNSIYSGDKEKDININMNTILELSNSVQELICVYDGSKEITVFQKEKITFMEEYTKAFEEIKPCIPIKLINVKKHNEQNYNLLSVLKALHDKYTIFVRGIKEV